MNHVSLTSSSFWGALRVFLAFHYYRQCDNNSFSFKKRNSRSLHSWIKELRTFFFFPLAFGNCEQMAYRLLPWVLFCNGHADSGGWTGCLRPGSPADRAVSGLMAQGQVSPTSGLLLLQWGVACPHPPVPLPDTWAEHLTPWSLTLAHVFHNRDPRVEIATVIYLPIELPRGWLWRLIPFLFVSLIFPEFVPVEEWLLDSQALWGLRSPVGEILSTSKEKQYLLPQRDRALHCYGYRIHVFWIFLLFKSFEKISQTRVCKLLLVPLFLWGRNLQVSQASWTHFPNPPGGQPALEFQSTGAWEAELSEPFNMCWEELHRQFTFYSHHYRWWPSFLTIDFKLKLLPSVEMFFISKYFSKMTVLPKALPRI